MRKVIIVAGCSAAVFCLVLATTIYVLRTHAPYSASMPIAARPSLMATVHSAIQESSWTYSSSKDEMRGITVETAKLSSMNSATLSGIYGGGSPLIFSLDKDQIGVAGIFRLVLDNGQFKCDSQVDNEGNAWCEIPIKADDGPILHIRAVEVDCGNEKCLSLLDDDGVLLPILRTSNYLAMEVPLYQFGDFQYRFQVRGLKWLTSARRPITISSSHVWKIPNYWKVTAMTLGDKPNCMLSDAPFSPMLPQTVSFTWYLDERGLHLFLGLTSESGNLPESSPLAISIDDQQLTGSYIGRHGFPKSGFDLNSDLPSKGLFWGMLLTDIALGHSLTIEGSDFLMQADLPGPRDGFRLTTKLSACLKNWVNQSAPP